MDANVLALLSDPDTRYPFELEGSSLRNRATGRVYPIREGIPLFVSSLSGSNLKHQSLYDRIAPVYDATDALRRSFLRWPALQQEAVRELELEPGARLLEIACGTGASLAYLPADIDYFGIDISWNMLNRCRKRLRKRSRSGLLFQGEACRLPFSAGIFDCVMHVRGINQFNSMERALHEMIWVAKPGAKIVIVDEAGDAAMQRRPIGSKSFSSPIELVPDDMVDVKARPLGEGKFYCLTFRKPFASSAQHPAA